MRIIPVMDLKGGQVVHAVGGRRDEYRPIESTLVDSANPELVARAFLDKLKLKDLYLADLDAIAGAEPAWDTFRTLVGMGLNLMVDAGVRDVARTRALRAAGVSGVVVGLETLGGSFILEELVRQLGPQVIWFSLDLKNGRPLGNLHAWPDPSPDGIAAEVVLIGVTRIIVLDLACVGGRGGTRTEDLCCRLITRHPGIDLVAGGGIRDVSDLQRLEALGVSGALVATAIHEGRLLV